MTEKSKGQSLLENAYKLVTPDDNKAYYAEFAATYDDEFADALGYAYPQAIATIYHQNADATDTPIADIGCGTGLVAQALACPPELIDGIDISTEMLERAAAKGVYRDTLQADLLGDLSPILNDYGAVVSAGTFTSGHVGPQALEALLDIARPGALFVIGVNKLFYQSAGFDSVMSGLSDRHAINDLKVIEIPMYEKEGHDHSADTAFALCYRKSPV